jgi:hypothetical protein
MSADLMIIASECKSACANEPDLATRIRKAMAPVAKDHWMFTGRHHEETRMKGALAAVLMDPLTTEQDKATITKSLNALKALNALMSGIPVDIEKVAKDSEGCIPLMSIWKEERDRQ